MDEYEYTDYSCSTSIERLARDVETVLRRWHVDQGSDRHYSSSSSHQSSNNIVNSKSLLRSELISWNLAFHHNNDIHNNKNNAVAAKKIDCEFELELKLWDGPPRPPNSPTVELPKDDGDDGDDDDDADATLSSGSLPYSLQRTAAAHSIQYYSNNHNWLDDFSSAFGIGQYLTLTPINAACLLSSSDNKSSENKPLHPSYQALIDYLQQTSPPIQQHHAQQQRHLQNLQQPPPDECIRSILTTWLQTALNLAAANGDCQFPVFGVWGPYRPTVWENQNDNRDLSAIIIPEWARIPQHSAAAGGGVSANNNICRRAGSLPAPVVSGRLLARSAEHDTAVSSSFTCYTIQQHQSTGDGDSVFGNPSWAQWGNVLLQHCCASSSSGGESTTTTTIAHRFVQLRSARHTFCYAKQRPQRSLLWEALGGGGGNAHDWRRPAVSRNGNGISGSSSNQQQRPGSSAGTAIDLTGSQQRVGVRSYGRQCQLHALQLLEHALGASDKDPAWGPPDDPIELMQLVLQWDGVEDMPLLTLPLQTRQDMSLQDVREMEDATESAILDNHRPSKCCLKTVYDHNVAHANQAAIQKCVLAALIRTATLPKETSSMHLIDDNILEQWDSAAGNRIAASLATKANADPTTQALVAAMDWSLASEERTEHWRAEEIVRRVFASNRAGFPSPPDSIVAYLIDQPHSIPNKGPWKPLQHAAPPGRLLSLLFVHMARVRSPTCMAMVWTAFCQELRRRWDARESLPNMRAVPALDPPADERQRCFSSVGGKGSLSAQIHSSEPDPDSYHCLIGQKLQVFNLGLESVVTESLRRASRPEKDSGDESMGEEDAELKPATVESPKSAKTIMNGSFVDGMTRLDNDDRMELDSPDESSRSDATSQEFYDAEEGYTERRGARCPVQDVTLIETGDQLYAPYLQRPFPLTDDVIAERRLVLARQNSGRASTIIRHRLEVAQRFQRPKLYSDMCSFKAANPGAEFEDFTRWYGNPTDPLESVRDSELKELIGDSTDSAKAAKLDNAAEAIHALEQTRNFWTKTWKEAVPLPATEQNALFEAESTVEMALDYLENLHPSSLLCQVMAVNLSTAYFLLSSSAGDTVKIRSVGATLDRLHNAVDTAIQILAKEVTNNITTQRTESGTPEMLAPVEAIMACTKACEALATAEVIVSRAASFLHKLPQQYKLVETIMRLPEGAPLDMSDDEIGRSIFLDTVHDQQRQFPGNHAKLAPAIREYLLHNLDDATPCQLVVRYSDDGISVMGKGRGGTVLALTKTEKD